MHDYYVNGPIPCSGCASNIICGTVYKLEDKVFICEQCYQEADEMCVEPKDGLKQFDEY